MVAYLRLVVEVVARIVVVRIAEPWGLASGLVAAAVLIVAPPAQVVTALAP